MPDFGDNTNETGRYQYYGQRDPNATVLSPEAYAEYQRQRRRQAILGVLGLLGATTALGAVGGALNGGGTAALSNSIGGLPPGMAPGGAAISSTFPLDAAIEAASLGGAATNAATNAATRGGANAAANTSRGVLGGLTARDLTALGLTGASLIGQGTQNRPNMNPTTATTDPNLQKLVQTMQGRLDASEPLYRSILSMANGLLPTQYQNGAGYQAPTPTGTTTGQTRGSDGLTDEERAQMAGGQ